MADETKVDDRFLYIKDRIAAAFPKLTGPKFEKSITEEAVKYVMYYKNVCFCRKIYGYDQ